jgi:hypothetical protein
MTCIFGLKFENEGFYQIQPAGHVVCFVSTITYHECIMNYFTQQPVEEFPISLLIFCPIGMVEPFDLSGRHHLLPGCTA